MVQPARLRRGSRPHIAPGEPAAARTSIGDVVLTRRLRAAIARLNPDLPPRPATTPASGAARGPWTTRRILPRRQGLNYALYPDCVRVVANVAPENPVTATSSDRLVFVTNFFDELRRLAPAGR
jgi:hypothetical protein